MPILDRCVTLGREFGRREMQKHLKILREFYVATRSGRASANTWSEDFIDEWLGTLQLPPFETLFVVHPAPFTCSTCNAAGTIPSRRTELTFPGGARMRCDQCGLRWLEAWPS